MEKARIERVGFVIGNGLTGWHFNCEGNPIEIFSPDEATGETYVFGYSVSELRAISDSFWQVS